MKSDLNESRSRINKERNKATKIGQILWFVILSIGILGLIFWKWYSILIAIAIAFVVGSVYSYSVAKKVQKKTGLSVFKSMSDNEEKIKNESDNYDIVHKYGAVLEEGLLLVNPISKLPNSKFEIKSAIKSVINDIEDEDMLEHLKNGYIFLANFVPDYEADNAIEYWKEMQSMQKIGKEE